MPTIEKLDDNVWRVEGRIKSPPLHRVMTIARLSDGGLVVHSAVALDDYAELDALGTVKYIVVPNGWHRLDAKTYVDRYPNAKVIAPRGSKKRVEKIVRVDASSLDDRDVRVVDAAGTRGLEAVMIVKTGTRTTLVFCDVIFNMPHKRGVPGFVFKHITQSSGGVKFSRIARWFLIKDKPAFAAQLEQLASQDVARVIVAHHEVIRNDPSGELRRLASQLR
ncbi:MAG TPA: hypothetical protein VGC41_24945 [Kofleriaceae bacterium]